MLIKERQLQIIWQKYMQLPLSLNTHTGLMVDCTKTHVEPTLCMCLFMPTQKGWNQHLHADQSQCDGSNYMNISYLMRSWWAKRFALINHISIAAAAWVFLSTSIRTVCLCVHHLAKKVYLKHQNARERERENWLARIACLSNSSQSCEIHQQQEYLISMNLPKQPFFMQLIMWNPSFKEGYAVEFTFSPNTASSKLRNQKQVFFFPEFWSSFQDIWWIKQCFTIYIRQV